MNEEGRREGGLAISIQKPSHQKRMQFEKGWEKCPIHP
jgi:hypothetical protein